MVSSLHSPENSGSRKWIVEVADHGRPFETHNSTTASWRIVRYPINPIHWFVYYHVIQDFLDFIRNEQRSERLTLCIQGTVVCPLIVTHHSLFRHTIYSLFIRNTPAELYQCIRESVKFRLFFISTNAVQGDEITINNMSFTIRS